MQQWLELQRRRAERGALGIAKGTLPESCGEGSVRALCGRVDSQWNNALALSRRVAERRGKEASRRMEGRISAGVKDHRQMADQKG